MEIDVNQIWKKIRKICSKIIKKFLKFFNIKFSKRTSQILQTVFVSFFTTMGVFVIFGFLIFQNKDLIIFEFSQKDELASSFDIDLKALGLEPELDKEILTEEDKPMSVIDVVKESNPKVVSVVVFEEVPKTVLAWNSDIGKFERREDGVEEKKKGEGSGFFVSSNGAIVTNRHVIQGENLKYKVYTNTGAEKVATLLAMDPVYDVAVLDVSGSGYPYFDLGNSDGISVGESVIAIGNALGEFKNSVSLGVVSGLERSVTASGSNGFKERLEKVIQTDAAINPGNSGGPLINLYGEVVGINVAVSKSSENIGFALPINSVKSVISSVVKTGKISRPYLGIRYVPITKELKEKEDLPFEYGVLVVSGSGEGETAILSGSPAERSGIKEGDIILSIDGQKLDSSNNLAYLIRGKKVGDTVKLSVYSLGAQRDVYVVLDQALD